MSDTEYTLGTYDYRPDAVARVNEAGAHAITRVSTRLEVDYVREGVRYRAFVRGSAEAVAEFRRDWR